MDKVRILSWNVNGIRAVYKKGFIDWFAKERPDILCVQETKAQEEQLPSDLLNIEGYRSYFSSAERKGYSGVALYTAFQPRGWSAASVSGDSTSSVSSMRDPGSIPGGT